MNNPAEQTVTQNQKRHTMRTLAGIEDALAIMVDLMNEIVQHQQYMDAQMLRLQHVLQTLRAGPNEYDPDEPCGRRPNGR